MKSVVAVSAVGIVGFFATAFNSTLEMWAPLIVAAVPVLVFMMWPVRDHTAKSVRTAQPKAA